MMSMNRTHEFLKNVLKVPISVGTIANFVCRCHDNLQKGIRRIHEKICKLDVCHFDETSFRLHKTLYWLHSASDGKYTYFSVQERRGDPGDRQAGSCRISRERQRMMDGLHISNMSCPATPSVTFIF